MLFLFVCPFLVFGNDIKLPSTIKEVTVFLSGAHITRTATCQLPSGSSEIVLTGLSTKIDESSIQISGLQSVSILSMSYDINYLIKEVDASENAILQDQIKTIEGQIAILISNRLQAFDLEKIKAVSTYYRKRVTAIKDEIFKTNLTINSLKAETRNIQKQMAEANNAPEKEQGELTLKFDAPSTTSLELEVSYQVEDAGWIPNYDIKSNEINAPLNLAYKAHVYQKTGTDWDGVNIILSTGNPSINVAKPDLGIKYLNFTNGYQNTNRTSVKKQRYVYNPSVKKRLWASFTWSKYCGKRY